MYPWIFALLIVVACAWLLTRPLARYEVVRRLRMKGSAAQAYAAVADLRRWVDWSPWLVHDANAELRYERPTEPGGFYTWNSPWIGSGQVTHRRLDADRAIDQELQFFKPFKSRAEVGFVFTPIGDGEVEVVWTMKSGMPLFMAPMTAMFGRMIGQDFDFGLLRLSALLDADAQAPVLGFLGEIERPAQILLVSTYEGPTDGIGAAMQTAYPQLLAQVGEARAGDRLAAYDHIDARAGRTRVDLGVPVQADSSGLAPLRELAGGRYFHVQVRGHYRFLKLAWHNAWGHVRMKKLRVDKSRPPLEVYANDSESQPSREWLTDLYIPIR